MRLLASRREDPVRCPILRIGSRARRQPCTTDKKRVDEKGEWMSQRSEVHSGRSQQSQEPRDRAANCLAIRPARCFLDRIRAARNLTSKEPTRPQALCSMVASSKALASVARFLSTYGTVLVLATARRFWALHPCTTDQTPRTFAASLPALFDTSTLLKGHAPGTSVWRHTRSAPKFHQLSARGKRPPDGALVSVREYFILIFRHIAI